MRRSRNDSVRAVEQLQKALVVCGGLDDDNSLASVLCNLGAAMMAVSCVVDAWCDVYTGLLPSR